MNFSRLLLMGLLAVAMVLFIGSLTAIPSDLRSLLMGVPVGVLVVIVGNARAARRV